MAPGDGQRRSRSQPTLEAEAPSPISTTAPIESPESPALASLNEVGLSKTDPSGIIILFI